jgi:thioredoxin-related protein
MKQIIILLLIINPLLTYSQGEKKMEIDWIPLQKAKEYAKKYNKDILIFFYKKDCEYCDKMKQETLSDPSVINMINNNFFPVKIDSRTKDTIIYNEIAYGNQQPESSGRHDWRHDFYAEVAAFSKGSQITTPTIVLFNSKFEKINPILPGHHPSEHLLRKLKKNIN